MSLSKFPNGVKVAGYNEAAGATITVGAESDDVVNVAIQLTDGNGDSLDNQAAVLAFYLTRQRVQGWGRLRRIRWRLVQMACWRNWSRARRMC